METDITHIFKTDNRTPEISQENDKPPPMPKFEDPVPEQPNFEDPVHNDEFTPIEHIQDEPSYQQPPPMMHPGMMHQPAPYYWNGPPPSPYLQPPPAQQWEPFKNISTNTWIILIIALAIGFFAGRYK